LVRCSPAEAAVDLMKLADLSPVATMVHCLDEKGDILDGEQLERLSETESLPLVRASEIIQKRLTTEAIVERVGRAKLPLSVGEHFDTVCFRSTMNDAEHLAIIKGEVTDEKNPPLVRVQAEDRLGDILACGNDSSSSMRKALERIETEGNGLFVYIRHPKTGLLSKRISVLKKRLDSISDKDDSPTDSKVSRSPQNLREIGVGAQILNALGARKIRLLSNAERDLSSLSSYNIEISEQVRF